MDSSMISKIEKAMMYASESDRIRFHALNVSFQGDHRTHTVIYQEQTWGCDCDYFSQHGVCSHVMAMERILGGSVAPAQPTEHSSLYDAGMISKIEKSMMYAQERDRIKFNSFSVDFRGDHGNHTVTYSHGKWDCTCAYFKQHGVCSHVMTLERMFGHSVQPAQRKPVLA